MVTHLTIRLAWHDRGWDGHICNHPSKNNACVLHDYIRDSIDINYEDENAGPKFSDTDIEIPHCGSE